MVTQIKPVLCPKCQMSVLGIDRAFGGRRDLTEVSVHHHNPTLPPCVFKTTWKDAQDLANALTRDLGNRK